MPQRGCWNPQINLRIPSINTEGKISDKDFWFCYFYSKVVSVMSDIVDDINKEFDDYQSELVIRDKKLKLLVDFSDMVDNDDLWSLLSDIRDKQVIL